MTPIYARIKAFAGATIATIVMLPAFALEPVQIFEKASVSIVTVSTQDRAGKPLGFGSGVVIKPQTVVTNCHVLQKARTIAVRVGKQSFAAQLEFPDVERDLCQLKVAGLQLPPAELIPTSALKVGMRVYAIGNPKALELTLSEGLISSLRDSKDGAPLIQTTAAMSPGSSGGGLFDSYGRLVGITTWGFTRDAQSLNFANPVDWIFELPERGAAALAKYQGRNQDGLVEAPPATVRAAPVAAVSSAKPIETANRPETVALAPPAIDDSNLPKGMPRVGDSWKYLYTDQWTKVSRGPIIYEVTAVTEQEIRESVRKDNSTAAEERAHSRAARFVENSLMNLPEFAPYLQAFGKLETTATWDSVSAESGNINKWSYSGRVIGTETVSTAAGTFSTLRVQLEGRRTNSLPLNVMYIPEAIQATYIAWYSPEVKRVVKVTRELRNLTGNALDRDLYELVEYKLAPR